MLILSLFSELLQYAIYMNIGNQIIQKFYYFLIFVFLIISKERGDIHIFLLYFG